MPETNTQRLAQLKKELAATIKRRNELAADSQPNPWVGELTKDIEDTRAMIRQLEQAIREGHP